LSGLELSIEQQTALLDAVAERIIAHNSRLAAGDYPPSYVFDSEAIGEYEDGKRLSAALRESQPPMHGTSLDVLLGEIFERAVPSGTMHAHPGFMAHIPSGGLLQAAAGTFIAAALNRFPGVWVAAPGLVEIECNVIRWYCRMLGYGDDAFGYLTTSGSLANMMGLMCACRSSVSDRPHQTIYLSDQCHYSVPKAARLIGVAPSLIRVIPTGPDCAIDVAALLARIDEDRRDAVTPTCIVATAGTTNTGAIDPLPELAQIARHQNMWLHVDACFGGFFNITNRGAAALAGISDADSIAVDAHKSLFLPHGNSALLVKRRAQLKQTFAVDEAPYLPGAADEGLVDFCEYGPELSREVRGLASWFALKALGVRAFQRCLDERLDLANYLADRLALIPQIEVVTPHARHLPVVVFKLRASSESAAAESLAFCEAICARQHVYLTTTILPGKGRVLRACILSHRSTMATVDALVDDVSAIVGKGG
jgi:aromatic-L-amino-acid/L-tryptophan decarboxylase